MAHKMTQAGITKTIESLQQTERELKNARGAICPASLELIRAASAGMVKAAYDAGIVDTVHQEIEDLRVRISRLRKRMQECQSLYVEREYTAAERSGDDGA